jgi:hypothetical protein
VAISGRGLDAAVLDALVGAGLVETYEWTADGAQVRCPPSARARLGVELVVRGVELIELHTIKSSLEDVFLALVRPS